MLATKNYKTYMETQNDELLGLGSTFLEEFNSEVTVNLVNSWLGGLWEQLIKRISGSGLAF